MQLLMKVMMTLLVVVVVVLVMRSWSSWCLGKTRRAVHAAALRALVIARCGCTGLVVGLLLAVPRTRDVLHRRRSLIKGRRRWAGRCIWLRGWRGLPRRSWQDEASAVHSGATLLSRLRCGRLRRCRTRGRFSALDLGSRWFQIRLNCRVNTAGHAPRGVRGHSNKGRLTIFGRKSGGGSEVVRLPCWCAFGGGPALWSCLGGCRGAGTALTQGATLLLQLLQFLPSKFHHFAIVCVTKFSVRGDVRRTRSLHWSFK